MEIPFLLRNEETAFFKQLMDSDKKLRFVTGKGGVGKTFHCFQLAAFALASSKKVTLVSTYPSPLPDFLKDQHNFRFLHSSLEGNLRDFMSLQLGFPQLAKVLLDRKIVQSFVKVLPGLSEIMLLGRLCHEAQKEARDLVLFDGFASGHFMELMKTPAGILESKLGGTLAEETTSIIDYLQTQSATTVVTLAEDLVVQETKELLVFLDEVGLAKADSILVNRSFSVDQDLNPLQKEAPHTYDLLKLKQDNELKFKQKIQSSDIWLEFFSEKIEDGQEVSTT